jgi:hypothetical protein
MAKMLWVVASSAAAAALGGVAVIGFTAACGRLGYAAETSGQVVIGTGVYGVARQIADLVSEGWKQLSLRAALARALGDYVAAAETRREQPRDHEALRARIRELRDLRSVRERDHFDRALRELERHGTAGDYALLSHEIPMTDLKALAARLG